MLLQPPTHHPSVTQVHYLFGEHSNDSSGWQIGQVVKVTVPSCKGQEFNCSNSRTFWPKALQQDGKKKIHSVTLVFFQLIFILNLEAKALKNKL